jgi:hypothetical protein
VAAISDRSPDRRGHYAPSLWAKGVVCDSPSVPSVGGVTDGPKLAKLLLPCRCSANSTSRPHNQRSKRCECSFRNTAPPLRAAALALTLLRMPTPQRSPDQQARPNHSIFRHICVGLNKGFAWGSTPRLYVELVFFCVSILGLRQTIERIALKFSSTD